MKVEKIDHIAIRVRDLDKAIEFFNDMLGTEFSEPVAQEKLGVRNCFDPLGIELVESLSPDGPIARIIERKGEGLACLVFKVPNLEEAIAHMTSRGITVVRKFQGLKTKAATFHPNDTFGVMIELVEYKSKHPIVALREG